MNDELLAQALEQFVDELLEARRRVRALEKAGVLTLLRPELELSFGADALAALTDLGFGQ